MTEIDKYFKDRGFALVVNADRELPDDFDLARMPLIGPLQDKLRGRKRCAGAPLEPRSADDDLVVLRVNAIESNERGPFTVTYSRSRGRVVGEQD